MFKLVADELRAADTQLKIEVKAWVDKHRGPVSDRDAILISAYRKWDMEVEKAINTQQELKPTRGLICKSQED